MKNAACTLFTTLLLLGALACSGGKSGSSSSSTENSDQSTDTSTLTAPIAVDPTSFTASKATSAASYDSADLVANLNAGTTVTLDLAALTVQVGSASATAITTEGVTPATGITVAATTYGITVTTTTTDVVNYLLSGTYRGTLTFDSSASYKVTLNGTTISAASGPALNLVSTAKAFLVSASGTTNTLADASSSSTMKKKGAIHAAGPLILCGDGSLDVTGNYKHGIYCADYLRVADTSLTVTAPVRDGIRTVNGFIFDSGTLSIQATGTNQEDESKGIKVEGSESASGAGKGYVYLNGGTITITSVGKAITAGWDIDEDATTTTTADDPDPFVVVNHGYLTLTTTGTPYETTNSSGETISLSPEGIEGKSSLTINGGYLLIKTTDDALNSGSTLTINDGYVYAASSVNDGIDSNGDLIINGGCIVAIGASSPECSFDYDDDDSSTTNNFTITGGTFVGIGGSVARPTALSQNVVLLGSQTSGSILGVVSSAGTTVFTFSIPQSCSTLILSAPGLQTGTTYTILTGGTIYGDLDFQGLYLNNLTYSGGTQIKSFTINDSITQLGGTFF